MSRRAVFLLTLPHTGTHFLRAFFQHMPGVREAISATRMFRHGDDALGEGVTLVWGHFNSDLWPKQKLVAARWRPITPMRDPLAIAISYVQRGYNRREIEAALTQWVRASRRLHQAGPHYVPLDLLTTPEARRLALLEMAAAAGFDAEDPAVIDHCERWSGDWSEQARHSAGPHPLKDAYAAGDLTPIKGALGGAWERLRSGEVKLRPWLEAMGYRDLKWWS